MGTYSDRIALKDKNIIVTGACGLLGREICKGIAEFGGNIIAVDIDSTAGGKLVQELSDEYGIDAFALPLDITSEKSVLNMLDAIKEKGKDIHGLVNNAYPRNKSYGTLYEDITFESWRENVDMHLNGYFNVTHKVSKVMALQGCGNIINMASIYGILGPDFSIYDGTDMTMPAEYSVIKGGIVNFTRYLATYLAKHNIRVNSISPGGIFNNQDIAFVEKYNRKTPLGRMGNPEEVVGGVIFLLSEMSSYITGHNLIIDGGWSVW